MPILLSSHDFHHSPTISHYGHIMPFPHYCPFCKNILRAKYQCATGWMLHCKSNNNCFICDLTWVQTKVVPEYFLVEPVGGAICLVQMSTISITNRWSIMINLLLIIGHTSAMQSREEILPTGVIGPVTTVLNNRWHASVTHNWEQCHLLFPHVVIFQRNIK